MMSSNVSCTDTCHTSSFVTLSFQRIPGSFVFSIDVLLLDSLYHPFMLSTFLHYISGNRTSDLNSLILTVADINLYLHCQSFSSLLNALVHLSQSNVVTQMLCHAMMFWILIIIILKLGLQINHVNAAINAIND